MHLSTESNDFLSVEHPLFDFGVVDLIFHFQDLNVESQILFLKKKNNNK